MVVAALAIVSAYAIAVTALWRLSAASNSKIFGRLIRSNGQFMACDAELNALKVKYAQALMQIDGREKR